MYISPTFPPHSSLIYPFSLSSPQQDAALCQSALHVLMRLLKPRKPKKEKVMHIETVEQQQGLQNRVYIKSGTYGLKFCR